jgi:hypothetical protein
LGPPATVALGYAEGTAEQWTAAADLASQRSGL